MALTVREVMNHELFSVRPNGRADDALATLLAINIGAAPVVDEANHPIGMVSWRDLARHEGGETIGPRMSKLTDVVLHPDEQIDEAARLLATRGYHHAPVVDEHGALVGFVSTLDLLCGLTGVPASHPPLFPHLEPLTDTVWTDERLLDDTGIEVAPTGPGVIAFIHGGRGRPERVIAVDQANDIRARLLDIASEGDMRPAIARALEAGTLRYRAAVIADSARRAEVAAIAAARIADRWFERIDGHD
jgi:CBS domain-containing protein